MVECSEYQTPQECYANRCYWWPWLGECRDYNYTCEDIPDHGFCERQGCYWYNNSCHTEPLGDCSQYLTQEECIAAGCYWYDESCHTDPQPTECSEYQTPPECHAHGCYWWPWLGECRENKYTCEDIPDQGFCERQGCYWYDNSCHSEPPDCSQYFIQEECTAAGCYWYNESCHSSPELQPDWKIYALIAGAVIIGVIGAGILIKKRRK